MLFTWLHSARCFSCSSVVSFANSAAMSADATDDGETGSDILPILSEIDKLKFHNHKHDIFFQV